MAENAAPDAGSPEVEETENGAPGATEGQESGTEGDAPTVESLSAELEQVRRALAKANKDAERHRRKATETPPADEVEAKARETADAKWKPVVVRSQAAAAFAAAGLQAGEGALPKVLKMLDVDALDVDDDGTVDGLDDQVEEIKAALPGLFAPAPRPKPGKADAGRQGPPLAKDEPKSSGARVWQMLQAQRGA